jgi:hypothetical protein
VRIVIGNNLLKKVLLTPKEHFLSKDYFVLIRHFMGHNGHGIGHSYGQNVLLKTMMNEFEPIVKQYCPHLAQLKSKNTLLVIN